MKFVCVPCIFAAVLPGFSIRPKGNIATFALKDETREWFTGMFFQTCGGIMFLLRYIISESKVLKLDFFSTRGPRKEEWTKWSNSVENPIIFTSVFLTNIFQVQTKADKTSCKNKNIHNIWLGHWTQVNIPEKWSNLCWYDMHHTKKKRPPASAIADTTIALHTLRNRKWWTMNSQNRIGQAENPEALWKRPRIDGPMDPLTR